MRKVIVAFFGVCVFLSGATFGLAQEQAPAGPPKVLRIFREEVKPGKVTAHENVEVGWPRAFARANFPSHYIAATSMSGPLEAWFIEGHDSLAAIEKTEQTIERAPALKAELDQLSLRDGELLANARVIVARYREELSYRAKEANIGQMRYFYLTTWRVRPGHDEDFAAANKILKEAHEKAGVPEHWAVFQVVLGMPTGTYLVFQPLKSVAEIDAFPQTHGKTFQDAIGDEGRKKLRELTSAGILTSETNVFAFNPRMSYVSQEVAAADPDFWTPKPVAAKKAGVRPKAQE